MIRLFVPHDLAAGAALPLDEGQSRYLAAVMRLSVGDELLAFNGRDGEWRARVASVGKRAVTLEAEAQARAQATGPDLDLLVALVKRARLETIVEKAAELGARRVRPVITERTNADHTRVDRLRSIAVEAAEQTGRLDVPEVLEPVKLERLIDGWEEGRKLLFCDEAGDALPALEALKGGTDYAVPASLGPRILRADTAAIGALTLWQAALGDWRS
jgi:16S rRNA (uracil1498-N3)-methyltransferase